jgi:hypothetical protein
LFPVDELELDEDDEDAVLVAQLLGEVDGEDGGTTIAFAVEEVDWGTSCDLA